MVAAGALYHMVEKLWNTKMYSASLVNTHFWLATIGAVVYITAMWVSGIMQGLMWRDYDEFGTLTYTFAESVAAMHPYYAMRAIGGMIYWLGGAIMLYNVVMTIRQASAQRSTAAAAA
jgi:cytochrome c oxidase cbb3-type subunit 1